MELVSEIRIVGSTSSLFLDLVLIVVNIENPDSHKYVVAKGTNLFNASS